MSSDTAIAFPSFAPSASLVVSTLISASTSASSTFTTPKPLRVSESSTMSRSPTSKPMPTSTCRSLPVQHDLTTPRARARAARLRANEVAEHREDLAALITTPAQWALLRRSFAGVKTQFADLDGMSWNRRVPVFVQSSTSAPAPAPAARPGRPKGARGPTRPLSVCASASAPVLSLDDGTVRPSQGRQRRRCIGVGAWVGIGDYVNGSTVHDYDYEQTAPRVARAG